MLDIYLLTLALSIGIGIATTVGLIALSRTERLLTLFHVRGAMEKPRWGGVVFLATFALTPFIASAFSSHASEFFSPKSGSFLGLLAAAALVFLVGFFDDVRLASPLLRSSVFITGGVAAYIAGYRIDDVGLPWGPDISFGPLGFVVTVLWIYVLTNAFNFIDGRDGVSVGVGVFACVTMAAVAAHSDHPTVALLLVALAGAGLGFLPFNLPPASTYVGDSGAYVMGFLLGTLSIRAATGPTDQVFMAVPLVALGYPIMDGVLAATRRVLHHKHPMIGDEDHIHHRLETLGAGPRGSLFVIYGLAALFSVGAILLHWVDRTWMEATVLAALLLVVVTTITRLGYIVTMWNSRSIVWLRQRVFAPESPTRND
jgi:UDP-GlcNAc:undecaprenyl-phosphate/decaprenyl-phosphate GlcNAc-1-phosphate transferase